MNLFQMITMNERDTQTLFFQVKCSLIRKDCPVPTYFNQSAISAAVSKCIQNVSENRYLTPLDRSSRAETQFHHPFTYQKVPWVEHLKTDEYLAIVGSL